MFQEKVQLALTLESWVLIWAWERNGETFLLDGEGLESIRLNLLVVAVLTTVWSELGVWLARGNGTIRISGWKRWGGREQVGCLIQDPKVQLWAVFSCFSDSMLWAPPASLSPSSDPSPLSFPLSNLGFLHGPSGFFSDSVLSLDESWGFKTI